MVCLQFRVIIIQNKYLQDASCGIKSLPIVHVLDISRAVSGYIVQIVIKHEILCVDSFLLLESYKKWRHVIWLL